MKTVTLKNTNQHQLDEVVTQAVSALEQGGLVIFPTETVYGLAADATNQEAVNKLLAYKTRREGKPLSIAVTGQQMAEKYVQLNQQALNFYQRFLPGPYTIISEYKNGLAEGVASEFGTVGVRWPDYQLVVEIVKKLGRPITATSANASGKKRPYSMSDIFQHLSEKQKKLIDLVIDAGVLPPNEPSTVIDTTHSTPITLRGGADLPDKTTILHSKSDQETRDLAGKLLLKHWNRLRKKGLLIALDGELGAGKTVFAKGIASFLQIQDTITSPTYTYINEHSYQRHQTQGVFYHLDLWRVEQAELAQQLKVEQLLTANNLVVIEWWDQVKQFFPELEPDIRVLLQVESEFVRRLEIFETEEEK